MPKKRQSGWLLWFPGFAVLRDYKGVWLYQDVLAGLVLTAMLVPVGVAYAVASGLPGIYGLYASIIPLLVYALMGPSRILILGPDSSLSAIILAVTLPLSGGDPLRAITLAGMMAIVSGLICLVAGFARLGFVTELLSKPIRYGYMNGIAIAVIISQIPKLLGFSVVEEDPLSKLYAIYQGILLGHTNLVTLVVGLVSLVLILVLRRFPYTPAILIAVVSASLVVAIFDLTEKFHIAVIGSLPSGLPEFIFPWITRDDVLPVLIGGFAVALVSFADTSVLSRSYAYRHGDYVDPNQEMIALGAANFATGLFQGFPVSTSSSRTPIAEAAGGKTQLTGVVGAIGVAALLFFTPDLLKYLPECALAAVVITSAMSLIEVSELKRIYRIQRWEFWLSIVCLFAVAVFGVIPGISLAIVISVIEFLWDAWRPYYAVLGRADQVKGYHDITRYPDAKVIPGLVLFRWDAPLFFANAELFQHCVLDAIASSATPVRWLVVAAEPVTSIDVTASDVLSDLNGLLKRNGIRLCFSEMKDPVKDKLKRFGLYEQLGDAVFFPTVGAAVKKFLDTYQIDWKDWEDRDA